MTHQRLTVEEVAEYRRRASECFIAESSIVSQAQAVEAVSRLLADREGLVADLIDVIDFYRDHTGYERGCYCKACKAVRAIAERLKEGK